MIAKNPHRSNPFLSPCVQVRGTDRLGSRLAIPLHHALQPPSLRNSASRAVPW